MRLIPIQKMHERIHIDRDDSDSTLFLTTLYYGEMVLKLLTAGMIAAVEEDRDRHRYRLVHRLVRSDGLGDWLAVLQELLTGPPNQFIQASARSESKELSQRCPSGSWQHRAATRLNECLTLLEIDSPPAGARIACLQWASHFVALRNKTRGHGAYKSSQLSTICTRLKESIDLVVENVSLFNRDWAYVKRNLSGKYRITRLAGNSDRFAELKHRADMSLEDGVYVAFDSLRQVELLHSDPEASDFLLPNGGFTDRRYEIISYISGETQQASSEPYLKPAAPLPPSETEGVGKLDVVGNCFTNIPPIHQDYVGRAELENRLESALILEDRYRIVSLRGPGGIGKTSLALTVLHRLAANDPPPYPVIVWFSARDIDLLPDGPKTVRAAGVSLEDFARMYSELLEPTERSRKDFSPSEFLGESLRQCGEFGRTLFVFDNFETVNHPGEIYAWIDTFIRLPNKVLITTRLSGEFYADYPVQVSGMSPVECEMLIANTASKLDITQLLSAEYRSQIIEESGGHPYVIKVLLGEVARAGAMRKVERIVAARDEVLTALFERTFASLSPAAQRIFLTLTNWRSMVAQIALEAVMLRSTNERIDVEGAVDELIQSSLVEVLESDVGDAFLQVPLAAALFGRRKLTASPWKAAVEADTEILRNFGAAQRTDVRLGITPRIRRFFENIAESVSRGQLKIEEIRPSLEFISRRYPEGWLLLADLYEENDRSRWTSEIKECLQRFLETKPSGSDVSWIWKRLADICRDTKDLIGEFHAIREMVTVPELPLHALTSLANRLNVRLSEASVAQRDSLGKEEKQRLIGPVAEALDRHLDHLDGVGCSRLAWLHMNLGNRVRAREVVGQGIKIDPESPHCHKLYERLAR